MADTPSNFALSISEKLVEQDSFQLTEFQRADLTDYERGVLARTAIKQDMVGYYDIESGTVTYRKRPETY